MKTVPVLLHQSEYHSLPVLQKDWSSWKSPIHIMNMHNTNNMLTFQSSYMYIHLSEDSLLGWMKLFQQNFTIKWLYYYTYLILDAPLELACWSVSVTFLNKKGFVNKLLVHHEYIRNVYSAISSLWWLLAIIHSISYQHGIGKVIFLLHQHQNNEKPGDNITF